MTLASVDYEYKYLDGNLTNAHTYLIKPILSLLEKKKIQPGAKILDLGCGNGSLSNILAQHGYDVTGIEQSPSGVSFAKHNFPECQFIQGSIYDSPLPQLINSFDAVISVEVIEHIFYPRELAKKAYEYLQPGGTLILTTPYHGYWKNLALAISGKMDSHFHALWDGGHIKFFSVKTLQKLLETEKFSNVEFEFAGRFPYLWKSMLCASSK